MKENGCMNLYIHDLNKNVFWKYNLTESLKQNVDCGEIVYKLPGSYQGAYYLATIFFVIEMSCQIKVAST